MLTGKGVSRKHPSAVPCQVEEQTCKQEVGFPRSQAQEEEVPTRASQNELDGGSAKCFESRYQLLWLEAARGCGCRKGPCGHRERGWRGSLTGPVGRARVEFILG